MSAGDCTCSRGGNADTCERREAHTDMVLVDTALNAKGDEVFVLKFDGEVHADSEDVTVMCDLAADMAARRGCKWDVTIQARNAADMS